MRIIYAEALKVFLCKTQLLLFRKNSTNVKIGTKKSNRDYLELWSVNDY